MPKRLEGAATRSGDEIGNGSFDLNFYASRDSTFASILGRGFWGRSIILGAKPPSATRILCSTAWSVAPSYTHQYTNTLLRKAGIPTFVVACLLLLYHSCAASSILLTRSQYYWRSLGIVRFTDAFRGDAPELQQHFTRQCKVSSTTPAIHHRVSG